MGQLWVSKIRLTIYVDVFRDSISDGSSILPASTYYYSTEESLFHACRSIGVDRRQATPL